LENNFTQAGIGKRFKSKAVCKFYRKIRMKEASKKPLSKK